MKRILIPLLLGIFTIFSASAADRAPRKQRKPAFPKKESAAATVTTTTQPTASPKVAPSTPIPPAEEPDKELSTPAVNDVSLGLSVQQTDSLLALWQKRMNDNSFEDFYNRYIEVDSLYTDPGDSIPDDIYAKRLRMLASPVPLAYNEVVKRHIESYVGRYHGMTERILTDAQYYFPFIEEELIKADLPIELRAMPIIESALNPNAVSRAGAVGLWQFMPSTGKSYGLEINSLVDERRDPVKSTQAAVRYMRDLYLLYGDWTLAIAAYNCGPGNVNKGLARSGVNEKERSFWHIYNYLPHETRGYVPAFIGATYALAYHRQHNIDHGETPIPVAVDTIRVNRLLHFEQISSTIDLPLETLRLLNPQYRKDIIPGTTKSYTLVLPQQQITQYIEHEAEIYAKDSIYLKDYLNPANLDKAMRAEMANKFHTVKKGETLGGIARKYHVSVKQLMAWNKIRNASTLRIGQKLRVK